LSGALDSFRPASAGAAAGSAGRSGARLAVGEGRLHVARDARAQGELLVAGHEAGEQLARIGLELELRAVDLLRLLARLQDRRERRGGVALLAQRSRGQDQHVGEQARDRVLAAHLVLAEARHEHVGQLGLRAPVRAARALAHAQGLVARHLVLGQLEAPGLEELVQVGVLLGREARHRVARVLRGARIGVALRVDQHDQRLPGQGPLVDQVLRRVAEAARVHDHQDVDLVELVGSGGQHLDVEEVAELVEEGPARLALLAEHRIAAAALQGERREGCRPSSCRGAPATR
jgi:hypothetical protein